MTYINLNIFLKLMNIWRIQKLKDELGNQTLSQSNLFFYYFITGIFFSLLIIPNFNYYEDYQEVSSHWIDWISTTSVYLLGLYLCFKANKGDLGKNFIDRVASLEVVLAIRYLIFLYSPLTLLWLIYFEGGIYSDFVLLFNHIILETVVIIRVFFCLKEISIQK